jgi:hypothetical protein
MKGVRALYPGAPAHAAIALPAIIGRAPVRPGRPLPCPAAR